MAEVDRRLVEAVGGVLSAVHDAQLFEISQAANAAQAADEQAAYQSSPEAILGRVAFDLAEKMRYLALHPLTAGFLGRASCRMSVVSSHPTFVRTPLLLQEPAEHVNLDTFDPVNGKTAFGGDAHLITGYVFQARIHPHRSESQSLEVDRMVVDQNSGESRCVDGYHLLFDVDAERNVRNTHVMGGAFTALLMHAAKAQDERYREARRQAGQEAQPWPPDGQDRSYYGYNDLDMVSLEQKNRLHALGLTAHVGFPDAWYDKPMGIIVLALDGLRLDRLRRRKK